MKKRSLIFLGILSLMFVVLACDTFADFDVFFIGEKLQSLFGIGDTDSETVEEDEIAPSGVEESGQTVQDSAESVGSPGGSGDPCDATFLLLESGEIFDKGTYDDGTRYCKYSLTLQNMSTEPIRFYIYVHSKDGYQHTEDHKWLGNYPITSEKPPDLWTGNISFHDDDKDFDGPVMSIAEKVAAIWDTQECAQYFMDEKYLEKIAIPVESYCPLE